jgi:hypothetical protein
MEDRIQAAWPMHLTPRELAHRWRISVRTLDRWRTKGAGPAWLRLSGRILYRSADVDDYERTRLQLPNP